MTLTIDGVNIVPFIAKGGLKWTRSDIDDPETGRDMTGYMHRGRVATKIRLDITCKILKAEDLRTVLNTIYPEYVNVTYDDPMLGTVTKVMYSNNNPAVFQLHRTDGTEYWGGITFPLVER